MEFPHTQSGYRFRSTIERRTKALRGGSRTFTWKAVRRNIPEHPHREMSTRCPATELTAVVASMLWCAADGDPS